MSVERGITEQNIIIVYDSELSFFEEFTKKHRILWPYEDRRNKILTLSNSYVGYITTPNRVISLAPKYREIGFEHILRLYLYVYGYRPTDSAAVLDISESDSSADVAKMFIENLKKNIQEGIIRTYESQVVVTDRLKGKVNYPKTYIRLIQRKKKYVNTKVSALSLNNSYNNLILSALAKLKHISDYSSIASELAMYFEGGDANLKNGSKVLESITFNSNTARYRKTLTYAAMIIDQLSYSDKGAAIGTDSFIINFDRLFEDFVAKILKEIPEKHEFSTWSNKKKFADIAKPTGIIEEREYQPDILYRYTAEDANFDYMPSAYAVLDVKNKAYGQFKNADIYQILTYSRLLHTQKAVLLYPSFCKRNPETLSLENSIFSPSTISACFVNIASEKGKDFLQGIQWFADTVVKTIMDIPLH